MDFSTRKRVNLLLISCLCFQIRLWTTRDRERQKVNVKKKSHTYSANTNLRCHAMHSKFVLSNWIFSTTIQFYSILVQCSCCVKLLPQWYYNLKTKWTWNQLINLPRKLPLQNAAWILQLSCDSTSFSLFQLFSLSLSYVIFAICELIFISSLLFLIFCSLFFRSIPFLTTFVIKLELCRFFESFFFTSCRLSTTNHIFLRAVLTRKFEWTKKRTYMCTFAYHHYYLCLVFIDDDNEYHSIRS